MTDFTLIISQEDSRSKAHIEVAFEDPSLTETSLMPCGTVQSAGSYVFDLRFSRKTGKTIKSAPILDLNGSTATAIRWSDTSIRFAFEEELPFAETLGFAIFTLTVKTHSGQVTLVSHPISVELPDDDTSLHVISIANYVIENAHGRLLNKRKKVFSPTGSLIKPIDVFAAASFIEDKIIPVYKSEADYFYLNARTRVRSVGRVDALEKLRFFTHETIKFVATHPEELIPANRSTGIRFAGRSLAPRRTWIQGNEIDKNIYENQIVLGFLQTVLNYVDRTIKQIEEKTRKLDLDRKKITRDSSFLIKNIWAIQQRDLREKLISLKIELKDLFLRYKSFMPATPQLIHGVPEPTSVFTNILAYRKIYTLLEQWIRFRVVKAEKNSFFVKTARISKVYEYYCLVKLIEELVNKWGFQLLDNQEEFHWKEQPNLLKENVNNIYRFKRGGEELVLYYDPKIACKIREKGPGLLLYRNSTGYLKQDENSNRLFFEQGDSDEAYTPDYVLKYKSINGIKYLIADAKFSELTKFFTGDVSRLMKLLFKYHFSISTVSNLDKVFGLTIFCGKQPKEQFNVPLSNVINPRTGIQENRFNMCNVQPGKESSLIPNGFIDEPKN